jgi:hypothetical protein
MLPSHRKVLHTLVWNTSVARSTSCYTPEESEIQKPAHNGDKLRHHHMYGFGMDLIQTRCGIYIFCPNQVLLLALKKQHCP